MLDPIDDVVVGDDDEGGKVVVIGVSVAEVTLDVL